MLRSLGSAAVGAAFAGGSMGRWRRDDRPTQIALTSAVPAAGAVVILTVLWFSVITPCSIKNQAMPKFQRAPQSLR